MICELCAGEQKEGCCEFDRYTCPIRISCLLVGVSYGVGNVIGYLIKIETYSLSGSYSLLSKQNVYYLLQTNPKPPLMCQFLSKRLNTRHQTIEHPEREYR